MSDFWVSHPLYANFKLKFGNNFLKDQITQEDTPWEEKGF